MLLMKHKFELCEPAAFDLAGVTFQSELLAPLENDAADWCRLRDECHARIGEVCFLEHPVEWVDRRAKLFEAGDFPDKGIQISVGQLQRLAENFAVPVPVLIEHADSPLELGYLTHVCVEGNELFGVISLTVEANALVEKSGARSLSLGLSRDLSQIREVSLVRNPRVVDAQLLPLEEPDSQFSGPEAPDWRAKYDELSRQIRSENAERQVAAFVREGKLLPSQAPMVAAMMAVEDSIEFDGESRPLVQLLIAMIERQPPHGLFSESVPESSAATPPTMLPEEADFYRKHFPDVSLEAIAQVKPISG